LASQFSDEGKKKTQKFPQSCQVRFKNTGDGGSPLEQKIEEYDEKNGGHDPYREVFEENVTRRYTTAQNLERAPGTGLTSRRQRKPQGENRAITAAASRLHPAGGFQKDSTKKVKEGESFSQNPEMSLMREKLDNRGKDKCPSGNIK